MHNWITNVAIEDYIADLVPARPEGLAQLEQEGHERGWSLIGPAQGQFLYLLTLGINAKRALEVGVTTGYAALWLLRALVPAGGRLTAVEANPERTRIAQESFARAGWSDSVTFHFGDWQDILPTLDESFDVIFLDVLRNTKNEKQALEALELCVPLLRSGGMLICDNVLCSAQVLEDDAPPIVRGIQRFNEALTNHPQLESVIIPMRDGVALCRKR